MSSSTSVSHISLERFTGENRLVLHDQRLNVPTWPGSLGPLGLGDRHGTALVHLRATEDPFELGLAITKMTQQMRAVFEGLAPSPFALAGSASVRMREVGL